MAEEIKKSNQAKQDREIALLNSKIEALEESVKLKNQEYDKLLNAYRSLAARYTAAGAAAKQIISTAMLSTNLLFADTKDGE